MSSRNRYPRRKFYNPGNIRWQSVLYTDMDESKEDQDKDISDLPEVGDWKCRDDVDESKEDQDRNISDLPEVGGWRCRDYVGQTSSGAESLNNNTSNKLYNYQRQNSRGAPRTFYNGVETESASMFHSLPSQKSRGPKNMRKNSVRARGYSRFPRNRGNYQKSRYKVVHESKTVPSSSLGFNNDSSDTCENPTNLSHTFRPAKYGLEFLPNSVNVNQNRSIEAEEQSPPESMTLDSGDSLAEKMKQFLKAKEELDSMKNVFTPADVIMDYRHQIQKLSEDFTAKNFSKVEHISSLITTQKAYASLFKLHHKNLILQQKQFDAYISRQKNECSIIHDNDIDDIVRKAEKIKRNVEIECRLFGRTLPAYAYKEELLRAFEAHEVIIISSDCSYFFNTAIPIILLNELPDYSVISCESSTMLCDWVKSDIGSILTSVDSLKIKNMNEKDLLNYLNVGISSKKHCFIFNLQLKRSVTSDLLLSLFLDLLKKQEDCRLILLLSVYDDVEKFQNYFQNLKVSTLKVPKLLLPVTTVWKKDPSKNYKEDVVSTALAIHVLNDPGDIFAFLPSNAEAKTTVAMFTTSIKELKYDDIECKLLHENSSNVKQPSDNGKRKIFFIPSGTAVMPLLTVRYVIDCGLTWNSIYDSIKNVDVLTTAFNSRAESRLRKSLVGVFTSGICYRTYSKENFCTDMLSYERPDILTLNPFNTLLTIFHHQPENALSVKFVEPLSSTVVYNTVKLLKNFSAVSNGKLTDIGKKMVKLPFSARYSKLILQSIQWGFAYEAALLVAFFSIDTNVFKYSKNEEFQQKIDAAKLELIQHESDALTFLYIYKCWTENKCSKVWCDKYHIEYETLLEIKSKVNEICSNVNECLNEVIFQEFSDEKDAASHITEMLFLCFADNLCVYSGHYRCGYRILASRQTAFLHPSTVLCNKDNMPQLIIFNKIIHTSRNFLSGITAVPQDLVLKSLTDKILDYDYSDVFERSLVSSVIEPVSERIIKQVLLGKRGKKLQEIENSMKEKLRSDFIIVDPSPEKGCVYIYALQQVLDSAVQMVKDILKSDLEDVINAEQVHILELKKGDRTFPVEVRCVMGAKITSVKIKDIVPKSDSNKKSKSITNNSAKDNPSSVQYSINLTWIRRPCNGICFVNFTSDSFLQARRLACRHFSLLDSDVYVEVSRTGDNQLVLSGIPQEAKRLDIEDALRSYIPGANISKIEMKFVKPFETTQKDIEDIKMQIQENCEEYTSLSDFDIVVPKPKDTASIMTAYINVFGSEDLTSASENLSNTIIRNFRVNAIPVYRSVVKCSFKIYSALETRITGQIEKLKCELSKIHSNKDLFRFEAERVSKDLVLIKLLSNDIKIMKHLQKALHELLEGEVLTKQQVNDIHKLFCHGGLMWLRTLEKSQKVYITEDYNVKIIRVYGSRENCFKVKQSILSFLKDTENEAVETIILSSSNNSRILLKSIIKEYGVNLKPFVELCNLRSAVLDIKLCRLYLHGSRDSIDQAKDIISMLSSKSDSAEDFSLLSSGEKCPVCDCSAFNLTVRLQHCGHLYCRECIVGLVEQANFPLQCCAENCPEDIVLDDIIKILDEDEEKLKKLLEASLNYFLEKHRSEIFYCPAPDCPMFAYKNEVSEKWNCPLCQNEICTKCNVVYHIGFTCDVYQGSKQDPDYSFKVWKKGTTECKECPKCKMAIEKNEGCDHMTCIFCKAHFCWVCVREFPTDVAVYNHIPFCDKYPKW